MKTGNEIRAMRKKVGWTQDDLARYLGIDRSSVTHIENGREPSGAVRRLLAILEQAVANDTLCSLLLEGVLRPTPQELADD